MITLVVGNDFNIVSALRDVIRIYSIENQAACLVSQGSK